MCCGSGVKKEITDTFIIDGESDDLVLLSADSTATRTSVSPVSGAKYYFGGNYLFVMAYPEDVDYLLSLRLNGQIIFTEVLDG